MEAFGLFGLFFSLIGLIIPIAVTVFLLVWIHGIKANSEVQVQQNQKIIELLEEINNK
ncbi:hypothetical protein [Paucisalibacillus sp. EB02]|uniref:hypothetical protein n=1 Tax=Paucisalibacillus sp. EB02 TaxID=1347087 RepID=UPI0004BCF015|nr:hypothetical protein [Paucisalibacillus sp. EB02]